MNLQQTSLRYRLLAETLSYLLMISVNGPSLEHCNPRRYIFVQQHNMENVRTLKKLPTQVVVLS
jgi:hypothetical protein